MTHLKETPSNLLKINYKTTKVLRHITNEALSELPLILLPHPPYSPDLAPSNFCLFRHLKKALRGEHFSDAESLKCFVNEWLEGLPRTFFRDAFCELHRRWTKVIEAEGSYIEK